MEFCKNCLSEHSRKSLFCSEKCRKHHKYYKNKVYKERTKECVRCGRPRNKKPARSRVMCNPCAYITYRNSTPERKETFRKGARKYYRQKKGIPLDTPPLHAERGSGTLTHQGYRVITKKGHPNSANKKGQIREHVFLMAQHLGRPLKKGETVHHMNGIRDDNRIENLEIWHKSHPPGQRLEDKISWCKEFLESYGHTVILNEKGLIS